MKRVFFASIVLSSLFALEVKASFVSINKELMICNEYDGPFKGDCRIEEGWIIENSFPISLSTQVTYDRGCNDSYFLTALSMNGYKIVLDGVGVNTITFDNSGNLKLIDNDPRNTRRANFVNYCNFKIIKVETTISSTTAQYFESMVTSYEQFSTLRPMLTSFMSSLNAVVGYVNGGNFDLGTAKSSLAKLKSNVEQLLSNANRMPDSPAVALVAKRSAIQSYTDVLNQINAVVNENPSNSDAFKNGIKKISDAISKNNLESSLANMLGARKAELKNLLTGMTFPGSQNRVNDWNARVDRASSL